MPQEINLHNFASTAFSYKAGDTLYLGLTFNYDVTNVAFEATVYNAAGAVVLTFPDGQWTLSGTRKKILSRTPVQVSALVKGKYRIVIKHTYQDGTVRTRFDSPFNVI